MDLIALVLLASTILFLYLCIVWNRDTWFNAIHKIVFAIMTIACGLATLHQLGWMVQIPG